MKKSKLDKGQKQSNATSSSRKKAKASFMDNSTNTLLQTKLKGVVENSSKTKNALQRQQEIFGKSNVQQEPEKKLIAAQSEKKTKSEEAIQRQVGFEFQTNIGLIDLDQQLVEGATLSGDESRWHIVADDVQGKTLGELEFVTSFKVGPAEIRTVMEEIQKAAFKLGALNMEEQSVISPVSFINLSADSSSYLSKDKKAEESSAAFVESDRFEERKEDGSSALSNSGTGTIKFSMGSLEDLNYEEESYEEEDVIEEMDPAGYFKILVSEHKRHPKLHHEFKGVRDSVRVVNPDSKLIANPQATIDLQLERINDLFILSGLGGVIPEQAFPKAKRWERSLSGENPEEGEMLYQIAFFIKREIAKLTDKPRAYEGIAGLSSLILSYLVSNVHASETLGYAKLIAPIMARTDFRSMWRLLSEEEKTLFLDNANSSERIQEKDDEVIKRSYIKWLLEIMNDFIPLPKRDKNTDPSKVFPKGFGAHLTSDKIEGPGREEWLTSIPGREKRKDLLSPPVGGSKSMGEKDATEIGHAIVELRRFKQNLPIESWANFAVAFVTIYEQLAFLSKEPIVK